MDALGILWRMIDNNVTTAVRLGEVKAANHLRLAVAVIMRRLRKRAREQRNKKPPTHKENQE